MKIYFHNIGIDREKQVKGICETFANGSQTAVEYADMLDKLAQMNRAFNMKIKAIIVPQEIESELLVFMDK